MKIKTRFMLFLVLFLSKDMISQTNYVLNSDFELGSIPNGSDQVWRATNWTKRPTECSFLEGTPDLFDSRSSTCDINIPTNKWAINIPVRINGNRYVGLSSTQVHFNDPTKTVGETIRGSISQLPSTCGKYNLSFYVHTIDGFPTGGSPCFPANTDISPNSKIEVYLVKLGSCTRKLIYSSPIIYGNNSWQLLSTTFSLTSLELAVGYDKIDIETKNFTNEYGQNYGGILFMDDFSITKDELTPSLTGNTNFCDGDPLTFNGSVVAGTATNNYWEIAESDASGNPVSGGYSWNSWYSGSPSGNFTFPTLPLDCDKFYRIKFAVSNECNPWSETTMVIKINCLPTVSLDDVILCDGDDFPVVLCSGFGKGYSFNWTNNGVTVGTASCLTVNNEGTYCVTVTKNSTGCSSLPNCATVEYDCRIDNSAFYTYTWHCPVPGTYFTVDLYVDPFPTCINNNTNMYTALYLSEVTGPNTYNLIATEWIDNNVYNPSHYSNDAGTSGYFISSFLNKMDVTKQYVITRGVLSYPDDCIPPRYYVSNIMDCLSAMRGVNFDSHEITSDEFRTLTSSNTLSQIKLNPNPSSGIFTASIERFSTGDLIQVLDYSGKVLLEKNIDANSIELNIVEMANGLYFVKVVSANGVSMEKLIKN